jgi:hypothetical protein
MNAITLHDLVPVLQIAIGPVILISGVGLVLLSLTNRFGRAADRARQLANELREKGALPANERRQLDHQVAILFQRARLIQVAVTLAAFSLLMAAVLIITLFLTALCKLEIGLLISLEFITGMVCLILSLVAFLWEVHLSLVALKLELDAAGQP